MKSPTPLSGPTASDGYYETDKVQFACKLTPNDKLIATMWSDREVTFEITDGESGKTLRAVLSGDAVRELFSQLGKHLHRWAP